MLYSRQTARKTDSKASAFAGLTVLIADDHHLVREGLKLCLQAVEADVTVLEAETLQSAIDTYHACPEIDVVLLDLTMPGVQGTTLDSFAQSCPDARIVVVSATYDMKTVQAALGKGILGFIPKLAGKSAFINALRFVLEGGIYIPPEALMPDPFALAAALTPAPVQLGASIAPVESSARRAEALRGAKLTARQIDVLAQLLDGKPNKQICRELNLSLGTVKCHVGAILGALEVNSRAEAIAAADKRGWREWVEQLKVDSRQASQAHRTACQSA
jgi:DNA-binding NarL/FixJ family response regulator